MKKEDARVRFTYRMSETLYEALSESAARYNISVNAEINRILTEYFGLATKGARLEKE